MSYLGQPHLFIDINHDKSDRSIVNSTINLGHNLGLKVVAEGVENQEALNIVTALGCDQVQGYYFSKPVPAIEFREHLKEAKQLAS